MAKRSSIDPFYELILKEIEEMVEEAMTKSANPHLPREEERTNKALTARIVLLGSNEMRAAMRGLIDIAWNKLAKKQQGELAAGRSAAGQGQQKVFRGGKEEVAPLVASGRFSLTLGAECESLLPGIPKR